MVVVDDAFQAIFQDGHVEVQQQSHLPVVELQVREHLGLMDRQERIDVLQFDNDDTLDDEVHPKATIQANALVHYGQFHLALELEAAQREFVTKTLFIGRFQKPWPQFPVDFNCRPDDFTR